MKDPTEIANKIRYLEMKRGELWCEIEDLVKSVVGMCVFNLNENGQPIDCRYCKGPPRRQ